MINIKVGNVVKSVGFGMYSDIRIIKTEIDRDIVRKKSSAELGKGTIIIASIAIIKITIVKSLDFEMGFNIKPNVAKMLLLFFAIYLIDLMHQLTI